MEGDVGSDRQLASSSSYSGLPYKIFALVVWFLSFCRGTDATMQAGRRLGRWKNGSCTSSGAAS